MKACLFTGIGGTMIMMFCSGFLFGHLSLDPCAQSALGAQATSAGKAKAKQGVVRRPPNSSVIWCVDDACEQRHGAIVATPNSTAFFDELLIALIWRQKLSLSEQREIAIGFGQDERVKGKIFDPFYGWPIFHSYALLAYGLQRHQPPGEHWVELGVHTGVSANVTRRLLDDRAALHGFDSFRGLPADWAGVMRRGAFNLDGRTPPVPPGVELHAGWFKDTIPKFVGRLGPGSTLVGVSVDCDLYLGSFESLVQLHPHVQPRTLLHFHELGYSPRKKIWPTEEARALYDYLRACPGTHLALLPRAVDITEPVLFTVTTRRETRCNASFIQGVLQRELENTKWVAGYVGESS